MVDLERLEEIGHTAAGALHTETGVAWHPANELLPAVQEIRRLRTENLDLRAALEDAVGIIQWMSGSPDFGEGGRAHAGWAMKRQRLAELTAIAGIGAEDAPSPQEDVPAMPTTPEEAYLLAICIKEQVEDGASADTVVTGLVVLLQYLGKQIASTEVGDEPRVTELKMSDEIELGDG